jgi:hypothetical protein
MAIILIAPKGAEAFRISLELSTSHSGVSSAIRALHLEDPVVHDASRRLMRSLAARIGIKR